MEQSFFNNLTDELLTEIFIRLARRADTIRCKFVCNRWLSLISSDYFLSLYQKKPLPFTFLPHHRQKLFKYQFNDSYVFEFLPETGLLSQIDLGFFYSGRPGYYKIVLEGSLSDLILCSGSARTSASDYCIVNVFTKQWIVIPPPPPENSVFEESESVGFLIEPSCVDNADRYEYLVLRIIPWGDSKFSVQMFSSEKGEWTKLVVKSPRNLNILTRRTSIVACGRMLYTFTYKSSDVVECVLAFDPFTNDPDQFLCVIDFPNGARNVRCLSCKLGMCGGYLRFAQLIPDPSGYPCIRIWELEDDYRMGKWALVHKRILTNAALCLPSLRPNTTKLVSVLAFHPYNEDLICFLVGNDHVVVYNIQSDKVESSNLPSGGQHQ